TAPVTYTGIANGSIDNVYNNWQSNWGLGTNYGTLVTAAVAPSGTNGLDAQTNSASLLRYNSAGSGSWTKIENTKTELISGSTGSADNKAYFMFVRGDRTVGTGVSTTWAQTTLAAKGKLQTGTQTFNYSNPANNSWMVGNPYAAPVDMSAVTYNNIGTLVYVWDPNLTGVSTGSPGAYNSFDRTAWGAGPIGGGSMTKYFQSGQAFLVKPNSGTASITFDESNKVTSSNNSIYTTGVQNGLSDIFNVILYTVQPNGDRTNVDGVRAKFGSNYSDLVDDEDGKKATGTIEAIALKRYNSNLTLEARPYIGTTDSLFLSMSNMVAGGNYEFKINPINFDASVSACKIIDNFLQTETPVSLNSNTIYPFSITTATGSSAAGRFTIVFTGAGALPTNKFSVKAYKQNNTVVVDWEAIAENNMVKYSVEKSATPNNFSNVHEVAAENGNTINKYKFVDTKPSTTNYYRIKATTMSGDEKYSAVVRVDMNGKINTGISVYPNPVVGNTIALQMSEVAEGRATLNIVNTLGQVVYSQGFNNTVSNGTVTVDINKNLAAGNYQLQLTDAAGKTFNHA
ncbi:T9SS C-terminal target domain-containing protein, partial [bacterium]|nr:T9SS C-terminal target domain-containing protein [bacterium]